MASSFKKTTINDTGSLTLPNGTTAQRPVGEAGHVRYNTDLKTTEYFNGSEWQSFVNSHVGVNLATISGAGVCQSHTNGAYRIHHFISGTNTFTPLYDGYVEVLVVGGGGGGGCVIGGGGGAGGLLYNSAYPVTAGTPYTVTVGKGGSGTKNNSQSGTAFRGSASYIAGPNLVTNGNFDTDVSGWTIASAGEGTFTWSSGQAILNNTTVSDPPVNVYQAITCEIGKTYVVTATKTAGEICVVNIVTTPTAGGGEGGFGNLINFETGNAGSQANTFVAAETTYYIVLRVNTNSVGTVTIDNVGVHEATSALVAYGGGGGNNNNGAGQGNSGITVVGSSGGNGEGSTITTSTSEQGNRGGFAYDPSPYPSGGGGGAGGPGGDATLNINKGGDGGPGLRYDITGVPTYYAGGGGGGAYITGSNYWGGQGGLPYQKFAEKNGVVSGQSFQSIYQGPGTGGSSYAQASNGLPSTGQGGGGGGGANNNALGYGADGGSGVVVVRYLAIDPGTVAQSFTDANFDTTWVCPSGVTQVELLVVAGGGGGGAYGGGGGAGGLIYNAGYPVTPGTSYTVRVGKGGQGGVTSGTRGTNGGNSYFDTLIAVGGGGGGGFSANAIGAGGGSGGGSGYDASPSQFGAGTQAQGNNGGGSSSNTSPYPGGGGGGAGGPGIGGTGVIAGDGGPGLPYSISGAVRWYAAGGGGGLRTNAAQFVTGFGGSGIGGQGGATSTNLDGSAGAPNTGSGGGGGGAASGEGRGGNGADGIVIIRWKP
jgi:hypothetical protein